MPTVLRLKTSARLYQFYNLLFYLWCGAAQFIEFVAHLFVAARLVLAVTDDGIFDGHTPTPKGALIFF